MLALTYDPRTARFDVTLDLPSSSVLRRQPARFTGTAIETIDAVTVDHPVERGEVLKASDLAVAAAAEVGRRRRSATSTPPPGSPRATNCGPASRSTPPI